MSSKHEGKIMSQKYGVVGPPGTAAKKKRINASKSLSGGLKTAISLGKTVASSGSLASLGNHGESVDLDGHASKMMAALQALWQHKLGCDIVVKAGNIRFLAHKNVLASCSGYFHDILVRLNDRSVTDRDGRFDVTLSDISSGAFQSILESIYSGRIYVDVENIASILDAANKLKVFPVVEICGRFLSKHLSRENCLRMATLTHHYGMAEIEEEAIKMAAENFIDVSSTFDFLDMNGDQLTKLFGRDDLQTESELDVFYRLLDWLRHDQMNRVIHAPDLLKMVRLPLLPPSVIVDHVESSPLLVDVPDCQELVKEALHYHCLPARQSILQSSRTVPRAAVQFQTIVTIGGAPRLKSQPVSRDVNYLDPHDFTWHHLTTLNEPRHHHAVAVIGGFIYVAGGEMTNDQRSPLNTVYRYDPRCDIWLKVASMKHQRESFQLAVLNGHLYAIGGRVNENKSLSAVESYNPAVDSWSVVASLSSPRRSIAVASYNGRIYAVGGSGDGKICSKVERYNPLLNKWEKRRPLRNPRFFGLLAPVKNRLYLIGGATLDSTGNVQCAPTVECYTPLNDAWTVLHPMIEPRAEAGLAVLGNHIYVIGGYSWDRGKRLESVERYDTEKNEWQSCTAIDTPYTGVGCCSVKLYGHKNTSIVGHSQYSSVPLKQIALPEESQSISEEITLGTETNDQNREKTTQKLQPPKFPPVNSAKSTKSKKAGKSSSPGYETLPKIKSQPTVTQNRTSSESTISLPGDIPKIVPAMKESEIIEENNKLSDDDGFDNLDVENSSNESRLSDDIQPTSAPDETTTSGAIATDDINGDSRQTTSLKGMSINPFQSDTELLEKKSDASLSVDRSSSANEHRISEGSPAQEVAKLSSSEAFQQIPENEKNKCGIV